MGITEDLDLDKIRAALPNRAVRFYEAMLATEADALAWARQDAPEGAVVAAGYQATPRGRGGLEWDIPPHGIGFSLILRPRLAPEREDWIYTVAASGVADALARGATIEWPEAVAVREDVVGRIGVQTHLGARETEWAVVTIMIGDARPKAETMARVVRAVEGRYEAAPDVVLEDYIPRCTTIGRAVRAHLVPLGPAGPRVEGRAVDSLDDGALVIETENGRRVAVRPQALGRLENLD